MSIYDKASLVLIPSGTKTSKVYSQKPTNGDGDFTFSRSTAATRVNASGNIEKETGNLLTYSNDFGNSAWSKNNATLTSGQSGYDGTNNAWKLESIAIAASAYISQPTTTPSVKTISVYAKAGSYDYAIVQCGGGTASYTWFDLTNGLIGTEVNVIESKIESVGGGWYRCSITAQGSHTGGTIYAAPSDGGVSVSGGNYIYIQDAQLEQGLVARDYIETTTTAIYGGITDNVPRLDYTDSSCPALLLEPQRTNKIASSEYFQSGWTFVGVTKTDNYGTSPEGLQNSTRIVFSGANNYMNLPSGYTGGFEACTIYMKGTAGETIKFGKGLNVAQSDLHTLTGNWQRLTFIGEDRGTAYHISTYGGATARDIEIWGAQLEDGSYATSYIPTYGSAVTRNEEILGALTGLRTNEITTTGAYTIFFDLSQEPVLNVSDGNSNFLEAGANDSSFGNIICSIRKYYQDADGKIRFYSNLDATTIGYLYSSNKKFCMVVNGTNVRLFTDGAKEYTYDGTNSHNGIGSIRATSGSAQRTSTMFSNILIFPTALTDQEAIDLTTT